jgi:hypothetical protein
MPEAEVFDGAYRAPKTMFVILILTNWEDGGSVFTERTPRVAVAM